MGYISTSDLSFLLIVEKIFLFKNEFETESVCLKAFPMLLIERNDSCFSFSPGHHLMQVSCSTESHEEHLSPSFSVGPSAVKIEVLMMGEFPEEDEGMHMKLFPFPFHYWYSYSIPTVSKAGPRKETKIWDEKQAVAQRGYALPSELWLLASFISSEAVIFTEHHLL